MQRLTEQEFTTEILARSAALHRRVTQELYAQDPAPQSAEQLAASPLGRKIELVLGAAGGRFDGQEEDFDLVKAVESAMTDVYDALYSPARGRGSFDAWDAHPIDLEMTRIMGFVQMWTGQNEPLVSYTTAAAILYPDEPNLSQAAAVARVRRLVERRILKGYVDPQEPNPRHARRVSGADAVLMKREWDANVPDDNSGAVRDDPIAEE